MSATIVLWSILGLVVLRVIYERIRDRSLPPGPRRLPLIGNFHQAPTELPWITYRNWIQEYGPITSAQFGGNTVIFIGDASIARDLLDKRGNIYSDRPRMVMAGENLTKGMHLLLRRYDERYKLHQRLDAPVLSPRASKTYYPLQDLESKQLLFDFLSTNHFRKVYERYAASLVYSLAYGIRLQTGAEPMLKHAHQIQENFGYAGRVGTWIVDALPFLNILPSCLAPWKKTAEAFYHLEKALHLGNMQTALASKSWNWAKEFLASKEASEMSDIELAYNVGILADAGLDTTSVQMRMFTLGVISYPEFVTKAQQELDEVIGLDQLPTLEDEPDLPYVTAVMKESLRWRSIVPGGIPHATLEEDDYLGYRIPKGATIISLFWAMALDENTFDRPLEFRPERWLEVPESGKERFVNFFGYGRRICTGRHIAKNSLFLLIARILWGFNICPTIGDDGKPKQVNDMHMTSGFVSSPLPFEAIFKPRSEHHKEIIESSWHNAEKDVGVILGSIKEKQISIGLKVRG
ncbi:cytochrome P450, putative [Talaromyces stipitatus ATCC 10500]|uniref:Cytochrome P450, putative n=1 Tax=Talaromyces stipitatus (strain ATCC 10500 / CBS 375.48 / QM 6759 / NRRL 1006) TaxID=441959 RepID=B8MQW1_TALSN|nr:cytochrome P450, putative [Talaromyces stipitatus ATCC 10500]EED12796.1 cytochrome P450, putative [Talaromyces stipitatus ATCC 10500]